MSPYTITGTALPRKRWLQTGEIIRGENDQIIGVIYARMSDSTG